MSGLGKLSLFAVLITAAPTAFAQQTPTPQAILSGTVSLLGAANIQKTTLSGSAEFFAGATDDTGSFTATCTVDGSSQLQLHLGSMSRTEVRQTTNGIPGGNWTDTKGQQHQMTENALFTTASWFCPHIALSSFVQNTGLAVQFVGDEQRNGASVVHFTLSNSPADTSAQSSFLSTLTKTEVYLDAQSMRPVAIDFNAHPDNDAKVDIPVEIRFSDYTNANGVWIPYTVQKYVNSSLLLTLKVQTAVPSSTL